MLAKCARREVDALSVVAAPAIVFRGFAGSDFANRGFAAGRRVGAGAAHTEGVATGARTRVFMLAWKCGVRGKGWRRVGGARSRETGWQVLTRRVSSPETG